MNVAERPTFGYIRARVMARHSRRPGPAQWQNLENCRGLEHFLQVARESGLVRWVRRLEASQAPETWERSLRQDWRDYLAELVAWTPGRWQPVLSWMAVLPMLPALDHLLCGGPTRDWMHAEAFFQGLDLQDPGKRRVQLENSPWKPLLAGWGRDRPLEAWRAGWEAIWPPGGHPQLCRLAPAWDWLDPGLASDECRQGLEGFFLALLRDPWPGILAPVAHLGLTGLDLLRLRGGLLRRRLRPPVPGMAT